MVFHALIAVKDGSHTGPRGQWCQPLLHQSGFLDDQLAHTHIACKQQSNWLTLANGSQVVSPSKCVLPLDIQTCQSAVECYTFPMSDRFDMILGQDWSIPAGAVISYCDTSIEILDLFKSLRLTQTALLLQLALIPCQMMHLCDLCLMHSRIAFPAELPARKAS